MNERVVVDASAAVDLLAGTDRSASVRTRLVGTVMHSPAHFDIEVLSALGRLQRAGHLTVAAVDDALTRVAAMPVTRHVLAPLLAGAWARRGSLRLSDALYVELAESTGSVLLTTDERLVRACEVAQRC